MKYGIGNKCGAINNSQKEKFVTLTPENIIREFLDTNTGETFDDYINNWKTRIINHFNEFIVASSKASELVRSDFYSVFNEITKNGSGIPDTIFDIFRNVCEIYTMHVDKQTFKIILTGSIATCDFMPTLKEKWPVDCQFTFDQIQKYINYDHQDESIEIEDDYE